MSQGPGVVHCTVESSTDGAPVLAASHWGWPASHSNHKATPTRLPGCPVGRVDVLIDAILRTATVAKSGGSAREEQAPQRLLGTEAP